MNQDKLKHILNQHRLWIAFDVCGERADLRGADLRGVDLIGADLRGVDLREADLRYANLSKADLREANLSKANLSRADLRGADLRYADLRGVDLREANLTNTILPHFTIIPEIGAFIGYKKLASGTIAQIEIQPKAKRVSSLISRKCRASKIKIIKFINSKKKQEYNLQGGPASKVLYKVGKIYSTTNFNDDIRIECASGIHFFLKLKEAQEY